MKTAGLALWLVACLGTPARADVLHVPQDFATIQAAVNEAQAGDEIVIAAGTYAESLLLDNKPGLHLRGLGKVMLTGGPGSLSLLVVQESTDVEFERLRLEGSNGVGVAISGASSGVTLRHCRVSDSVGVGIVVEESDHILLDHVDVAGTGDAGFSSSLTDFVEIRHCTFTDLGSQGIEIAGGTGHLVEHVKVTGAGEDGIFVGSVTASEASIVRKSIVKDVGQNGISARGSVLIEDNRVLETANVGVLLLGGTCIARDNRVIRPTFYGLAISGGTHQVLDNRFVQPGEVGLRAVAVPSQVFAGNRVLKSVLDGILIGAGSDLCTLTDNKVVSPANNGIAVVADEVVATGNRVTHAAGSGWFVLGTGGVFLGNKAKGSGDFDLFDASGGGNTYVDNDFGTTQFE